MPWCKTYYSKIGYYLIICCLGQCDDGDTDGDIDPTPAALEIYLIGNFYTENISYK